MAADLSRVRFDALRDHSGVVLQQGRLLLDADWNELVDVLDRRLRASIADLDSPGPAAGAAGVAVVPRTTPDGFAVTLSGGTLSIGRGRLYVDGVLAENHGTGPAAYDALLGEQHGSTATPYDQQPYWPTPTPLPTSGTWVAYLDVWQRTLTHVEAPDLVDPAIAVDTTARTQTAWQVRLHPVEGGGVTCATPDAAVPGWTELTAPSGGRLSVDTIAVDEDDDPCALPPTGGYRGLENQTYRVEIHTGGPPGTATFKWSRDNGSVVQPVLEVLPGGTALRPASFGRDAVLGLADRDWVEVLDDHRELAGVPGEVRQVEVDELDGTLGFSPPLPADLQLTPAQAAARHLRVRRWDQQGRVRSAAGATLADLDLPGASGVITVPASATTQVVLEHGIVVGFDASGAGFRAGDHWVFAARTADTSVERLTDAPPRGTQHHYARLAVVTFPGTVSDCRTPWPPECDCEEGGCSDCTVCVTPESHASGELTVQMAVDRVEELGGGTVCLSSGAYHLDEAGVRIEGASSLRVRGQGLRTVLFTRGAGVEVVRSAFVTLEDLTVVSASGGSGVTLQTTVAATVQRLTLLVLGEQLRSPALRLAGVSLLTRLHDNVVVAPFGISGGFGERGAELVLGAELSIRDNLLVCRQSGIFLAGGWLLDNRISGNTVLRASGEVGIGVGGPVAPGSGFTVGDNTLFVSGVGGIGVGTGGYTVVRNQVTGVGEETDGHCSGIQVVDAAGAARGCTRIGDNVVRALGGRGIWVLSAVEDLVVSGNAVTQVRHGIVMDDRARAETVEVAHNRVVDVGSWESHRDDHHDGIQVLGARQATVESNLVRGVGEVGGGRATGIDVLACVESRVAGNTVDRIGLPDRGGEDLGIGVRGLMLRTQVSGNSARRRPEPADQDADSAFRALQVGLDGDRREVPVELVKGLVLAHGETAFALGPLAAHAVVAAPQVVTVDGNHGAGGGRRESALVAARGDVVLTGNQLQSSDASSAPALRLVAEAASVGHNTLRGGDAPAALLEVDPKRLATVGNLYTHDLQVLGSSLGSPWDVLNVLL